MTWAELMEANEAFDELLDLKNKTIEIERDKAKSETLKANRYKIGVGNRIGRR